MKKIIYFCHFPKTGGSYTEHILKQIISPKYIFKILIHGINYEKYKNKDTILITCIRNPYDSIESLYSHGQLGFANIIKHHNIKNFDDYFNKLIQNKLTKLSKFITPNYFYTHSLNLNTKKPYFDHIIRNENLIPDIKKILKKLNINYDNIKFDLNIFQANSYLYPIENNLESYKNFTKDKLERKNKQLINKEKRNIIYNKYKLYCDTYNYLP